MQTDEPAEFASLADLEALVIGAKESPAGVLTCFGDREKGYLCVFPDGRVTVGSARKVPEPQSDDDWEGSRLATHADARY